MLVSEDYPWGKLLREYATYCAVGCINVAVFFLIYDWLYDMVVIERWRASSAWAIAYFISSWQAHFLHRWLTFESKSSYGKSLYMMMIIYAVLWALSTASIAYFSDTLGYNHLYSYSKHCSLWIPCLPGSAHVRISTVRRPHHPQRTA